MVGLFEEVHVVVYANTSMTHSQLDFLVCTFLICYVDDFRSCDPSSYENICLENVPNTTCENHTSNNPNMRAYDHTSFAAKITSQKAERFDFGTFEVSVYGYVIPAIKTFGILAIFAYFFTLYRVRALRNFTNLYLSNLAVADLMLLLSCFTIKQYQVLHTVHPYGFKDLGHAFLLIGSVMVLIQNVSAYTGFGFCTLITVERYRSICHPHKYKGWQCKKRAILLVILTWVVTLAPGVVEVVLYRLSFRTICLVWPDDDKHRSLNGLTEVINAYPTFHTQLSVFFLVLYFLLLLTNAVLNALLLKKARKLPPTASKQTKTAARRRNRVTVVLFVNCVVFFGCYLLQIVNIAMTTAQLSDKVTYQYEFGRIWNGTMVIVRVLNSSINPIIFNVGGERFRQAFLEAFCCRKPEKKAANVIALQPLRKRNDAGV